MTAYSMICLKWIKKPSPYDWQWQWMKSKLKSRICITTGVNLLVRQWKSKITMNCSSETQKHHTVTRTKREKKTEHMILSLYKPEKKDHFAWTNKMVTDFHCYNNQSSCPFYSTWSSST